MSSYKDLMKPEGRSWCEHFPPPPLEKFRCSWKLFSGMLLLLLLFYHYYYCCRCCCCRWRYLLLGFQVCYKVRQRILLQSATAFLLQSVTSVLTKCHSYYKVRQNKLSNKRIRPPIAPDQRFFSDSLNELYDLFQKQLKTVYLHKAKTALERLICEVV